jgi:putative protease
MLASAKSKGANYALVGNLGHLQTVLDAGLEAVGDYRFNLCNAESVAQMEALGVKSSILSPELSLPQIRDVGGNTAVIVYGRLPLMTLEKCVIREVADCRACADHSVALRDRRGVEFPILREWEHRNVICNSIPTCMSDREDALARAKVTARHFLFTTETPQEVNAVIEAHKKHAAVKGNVRRI